MELVQVDIDISDVADEFYDDDRVGIYAPATRNDAGQITSTAMKTVPLVDGKATVDLKPGAVVVRFICRGVADTREKPGWVPEQGPVSLADVILKWTPALVDQGILAILSTLDGAIPAIEGARDDALGQVSSSVDAALDGRVVPLETDLTTAISVINATGGYAGRLLRLDENGKLRILTSSVVNDTDVANRKFVTDLAWRKGELGDTHLDTVRYPGTYRQGVRSKALASNGYPADNVIGQLTVFSDSTGAYPVQEFVTWDTPIREYRRRYGSKWSPWEVTVSDTERNEIQLKSLIDPDGYFAPAGQKLTLPTHDGSGQATHPGILHFPETFGGYHYWMAATPFPNGNDAFEDPDIYASQDGTMWVVPEGLTNPLDDAPGNPQYNSDTHLAVGPGGAMWCFWRFYDKANTREVIYGRSTLDGVTWTPREEILVNDQAPITQMLSPSFVYDSRGAGSWRVWVVTTGTPEGAVVRMKHSTGPTGWNFTAWQSVTVAPLQGRYRPWHISMRYTGGQYVGLLCASDSTVQATYDNLMLVGDTPTSFRASYLPVIQRDSPQHTSLYRADMVPVSTPTGVEWDVFYGGIYQPANSWHIFRSRMKPSRLGYMRDSLEEKLTPPDSGWRDISADLREGWEGTVRVCRVGREVFVSLYNLKRTSGTDYKAIALPRFGFLPKYQVNQPVLTTGDKVVKATVHSWSGDYGSLHIAGGYATGDVIRANFSFPTEDKPPAAWPGISD